MGRVWKTIHPDGATVTNVFNLNGSLQRTSGARTYPVEYTYDYAGRMKPLTTWQDFAADSGKAITTWNYHSTRGWLTSKHYHDGNGTTYTYHPSGRLKTRTRQRGITTTYGYDGMTTLASWIHRLLRCDRGHHRCLRPFEAAALRPPERQCTRYSFDLSSLPIRFRKFRLR